MALKCLGVFGDVSRNRLLCCLGGTSPIFEVLDWIGQEIPARENLQTVGIKVGKQEATQITAGHPAHEWSMTVVEACRAVWIPQNSFLSILLDYTEAIGYIPGPLIASA